MSKRADEINGLSPKKRASGRFDHNLDRLHRLEGHNGGALARGRIFAAALLSIASDWVGGKNGASAGTQSAGTQPSGMNQLSSGQPQRNGKIGAFLVVAAVVAVAAVAMALVSSHKEQVASAVQNLAKSKERGGGLQALITAFLAVGAMFETIRRWNFIFEGEDVLKHVAVIGSWMAIVCWWQELILVVISVG